MKKLFTILTIVALTTTISFSQVEVEQGSFLLEIGNNRFLAQSVNSIDGISKSPPCLGMIRYSNSFFPATPEELTAVRSLTFAS